MALLRPRYRENKNGKKQLSGYSAEFYDPERYPKRKNVTLRTKDKIAADQKRLDLERRYAMRLYDPWEEVGPQETLSFDDAARKFLAYKEAIDLNPKTLAVYRETLNSFSKGFPPTFQIRMVEAETIRGFIGRSNLSPTSKNSYYRRLKTFFSWCAEEGIVRQNPMSHVRKPKAPRKVISDLSKDEYDVLIRTIEEDIVLKGNHVGPNQVRWLVDLIKVAVGTGLRRGELLNLKWDSVDLTTATIVVKTSAEFQTKSGHERTVFIAGVALDTITRLHGERLSERTEYVFMSAAGGRLSPHYVTKRFRHYRGLAGLPDHIHFHSLRHTYASWLVLAGVDLYRVKELMGLSTVQLVMRYAHLAPKTLKAEVERVFG